MGVGVVIRDSIGDFFTGFFKRAPILLDSKMAEAYALNWGIQVALEASFRDLHLEGNCLTVSIFNKIGEAYSYACSLVYDAKKYFKCCQD